LFFFFVHEGDAVVVSVDETVLGSGPAYCLSFVGPFESGLVVFGDCDVGKSGMGLFPVVVSYCSGGLVWF
jgi:hypothetical protein